jgi:hypothetical protein
MSPSSEKLNELVGEAEWAPVAQWVPVERPNVHVVEGPGLIVHQLLAVVVVVSVILLEGPGLMNSLSDFLRAIFSLIGLLAI